MPFDDIGILDRNVAQDDELTALGITPVDPEIVNAHKAKMLQHFRRVDSQWKEYPLRRDRIEHTLSRLADALRLDSLHLVGSAPAPVIAIAKLVRNTVPDAEFEVGVFYVDPYLKVTYGAQRKVAYLGVWLDQQTLVAVARRGGDGDGDPLSLWNRVKRRFKLAH
jgi:hypothetical protein